MEDLLFGDYNGEYNDTDSYGGEFRISILNLDEDPLLRKKLPIRVSEKNKIMRKKLSLPDKFDIDLDTPITSSYIQRMESDNLNEVSRVPRHLKKSSLGINPNIYKVSSCFMIYVLGENGFRSGIAESELKNYRRIFNNILQKSENCHEAHFGLGKLSAYTGMLADAVKHFKKAISIFPSESLYHIWCEIINDCIKSESKSSLFSQKDALMKLAKESPNQVEYLWALMVNSFHTSPQSNYLLGKKIASRIKKVDDYFGYLAWSQIFIQENNIDRGVNILRELIADQNTRPEAYYKLWRYYYEKDQYRQAEEIAAQAFVKVTHLTFSHYFIIFCICYAKSFVRTGKIRGALELLQQKYLEHPKHAIFLYQYGRFCIKNAEEAYLICGITALEECLRVCDISLHGKISFWLGKGYLNYDFPTKCNKYLNESLKLLQHTQIKKNSEIHTLLGRLNTLITKLKHIETSKNIAKADEMSVKIVESHPIDGVIAFAKSLWAIDKEGSLSILLGHKNNISRCDFHFLIFSYAKKMKDFKTLKSLTKKLVDRCKDMMITTSEWMLCHIWFAKALAQTGKPDKAIFLLKCLGKVFPDLPYMDLKYTKALSSASTVLDLVQAKYVDQDFRNSVHIVSNAYLTALAARDVPLFLQEKKDQAQIIYAADSIIDSMILDASLLSSGFEEEKVPIRPTIHRYKEKRSKLAEVNEIASQKFEVLLQKRNRATFLGFSLSSDPEFLYQIGKIALVNSIELDDGLCAIEDFLEITENPIKRLKGTYIKSMLFYKKNQPNEYMPLMQDICFLLKKNNLNKEYNIVKEILDVRQ